MRPLALIATTLLVASCSATPGPAPAAKPSPPKDPAPRGFAQVTAKCAQIASCAHSHDAPGVRDPSVCVDEWMQGAVREAQMNCLLKAGAGGCKEIQACLHGGGDFSAADFCSARPGVLSACDGKKLVTCAEDDSLESQSTDCAALDATCTENRVAGGLIVRGCASPKLCPVNAPEWRCEAGAGAILSCHDTMVERAPCPSGERCVERLDAYGEQMAVCEAPASERCADVGLTRCDGNVLVECIPHGRTAVRKSVDCAKRGLSCGDMGKRLSCIVPALAACVPGPAHCDGDSLVYCAAGMTIKVSCTALGFDGCDPGAHGPEAACRPK